METQVKSEDIKSEEINIEPQSQPNEIDTQSSQSTLSPQNNNTILKRIGNFFLTLLISIGLGLLNFIKSNWLILLIIGSIIYGIYYLYSNASKFIGELINVFDTIQPALKSSVDILDSTISKLDLSNNISSIQKINNNSTTKNDNNSLEEKLQTRKQNNDLEESDNEHEETNQYVDKNEFNTDGLTESNNNHDIGSEGYCFIGNDNGIRACAPIGKNNKCMSGDIFPSMEICMNPKLRS